MTMRDLEEFRQFNRDFRDAAVSGFNHGLSISEVADAWKVTPEDVVISLADTAAIPMGFGTMASRSTVTVSAAIHHASLRLREKAFAIAANLLECAPADLELRDGGVGVVGVPGAPGAYVSFARLAQAARPG